jgi:hypothetical protein
MRLASTTKTKVILDRGLFEELIARKSRTERLAVELRRRLEEEHELLLLALHELARERGRSDHAHFVRRWLRERRSQEPPVPLAPKGGGGSTAA